jgi:O-antigen/teichoic acid export membrane protein
MTSLRQRMERLLPKGRFWRGILALSSGTAIGQLLVLAVSPLLTRLFTPMDFGVLAVFTALVTIIGRLMVLAYSGAIQICRNEGEAAATVVLCFWITGVMTALCALVFLFWGPGFSRLVGLDGDTWVLWTLVVALMLWGLSQPLANWSMQRREFTLNASNRVYEFGSRSFSQLAFGFTSLGGLGLSIGYTIGYVVRLAHFFWRLRPEPWRSLREVKTPTVIAMAREHWRFPLLFCPSILLGTACQFFPSILVAVLYDATAAGWFGLGQRMFGLPLRLLTETVSNVYLTEIAHASPERIDVLFRKTTTRFALMAAVGVLPIVFFGGPLFAFAFGAEWYTAGTITQILIPSFVARFVVGPVVQTLNVLRRQDLHLFSALLEGATMLVAFALGWYLQLSLLSTMWLYSGGSTIANLVYLGLIRHVIRTNLRLTAGPTP